MPVVEDLKHLWHDLLFYFGRRKRKAYYGRYNYAEKAEYLAVVWGTFIMIITGFMMWNPIATTNYLPGQVIPAAKAAHGGEAVLAALAIILWHFYHVHLRHFNKSMFIGKMTRHEMEEEHPAELALIEAGKATKAVPPAVLRRRQKIFYPIAAVIVIVSGILLLGFITFEKTAIETVPPAISGPGVCALHAHAHPAADADARTDRDTHARRETAHSGRRFMGHDDQPDAECEMRRVSHQRLHGRSIVEDLCRRAEGRQERPGHRAQRS